MIGRGGLFRIRSSILSLQSCIRWVSGIPQSKGTTSTFSRVRVSYSFTVLPFLRKAERAGARPALHLLHDDDLAGVDQIAHVLQEVVGDVLLGPELQMPPSASKKPIPLSGSMRSRNSRSGCSTSRKVRNGRSMTRA